MPWFLKQGKALKDGIITLARQKVPQNRTRIQQKRGRKEVIHTTSEPRGAAAEADAITEQQLRRTRSRSSS